MSAAQPEAGADRLPKPARLVCSLGPARGTVSGTTLQPQAVLTLHTLQLEGAPLALAGLAAGPAGPAAADPAVRAAHPPAPPPQVHPGPCLRGSFLHQPGPQPDHRSGCLGVLCSGPCCGCGTAVQQVSLAGWACGSEGPCRMPLLLPLLVDPCQAAGALRPATSGPMADSGATWLAFMCPQRWPDLPGCRAKSTCHDRLT